jgi:hypothetical protein
MNEGREVDEPNGVSRRDVLRRGAIVGAAAVWTVPLVQVVSMTAAHADSPSAPVTRTTTGVEAASDTRPNSVNATGTQPASGGTPSGGTASGSLPFTGNDVPVIGTIAGVAALAVGAGLVAATRKHGDDAEPTTEA